MIPAARVLRILALAVWLGGIIFFGAVVAPGAAHIFGTTESFADFIGHSIYMLHGIGLWCGVILFITLRVLGERAYRAIAQGGLVFAMLILTYISNGLILRPMEHDRAVAGGDISVLLPGSPLRSDFDARHVWSTRVEGAVLFCGLALTVLIGMEDTFARTAEEPRKIFDLSSDD